MSRDDEWFDEWWQDISTSRLFCCDSALEARLRRAFYDVLEAMSSADLQIFKDASPALICITADYHACVVRQYNWYPSSPAGGCAERDYIYIDSRYATGTSEESLPDMIAHEAAHVVCGHSAQADVVEGAAPDIERAADEVSAGWGFRRRYTEEDLRGLAGAEEPQA